jgi:dethiobiotin synthetase
MKPKGYFITGTDTEIGKTLAAAALILRLRQAGQEVICFKPVVAGTYSNALGLKCNEDLETLRLASGTDLSNDAICPYILDEPAAPHLVSGSSGVTLKLNEMTQSFENLSSQFETVVVEGAGGFLVPINEDEGLDDFAQRIGLPVILVVGMRLGCLNHALLTAQAVKARGLELAGWVANQIDPNMARQLENLESLKTRLDAPYLGIIPHLSDELKKTEHSHYSWSAIEFAAQHLTLPHPFNH